MALSKKHFKAIADILNQQVLKAGYADSEWKRRETIIEITGALSSYFATETPNFDAGRFKQAVYSRDNSGVTSS